MTDDVFDRLKLCHNIQSKIMLQGKEGFDSCLTLLLCKKSSYKVNCCGECVVFIVILQ